MGFPFQYIHAISNGFLLLPGWSGMDQDLLKTKSQLIEELQSLRKWVAELERCQNSSQRRESPPDALGRGFPDLNFIYDIDGRYVDFLDNQRSLIVYPEVGDLKGSLVTDVLPGEVSAVMLDAIRRCVDAPEYVTIEYQLEVPVGIRWFEGRLAPIIEGSAKPRHVLLVARDITERKALELAQADLIQTLQRKAAGLPHLPDIIPVCSFCQRVRDDQGRWHNMAAYFLKHFKLRMSHGVCKDCMRKHYAGLLD